MRRSPLLITAGVLVLTVSAVIAVKYVNTYVSSASAGGPPAAVSPSSDTPDGTAGPSPDPSAEAVPGADDPAQQARFQAAADLVQKTKGHVGVIVHDRKTGGEWRAGEVDYATWTASTIKLAIAENLLERSRTGEIKLDTTARKNIADMLDTSSDLAADALWDKYGKDAFLPWFQQQYGMANLQFPAGAVHKWSQLKGTADDLIHLMTYVLDRADPADRDYLMAAMRRTSTLQHWGVWAAGADKQPGVKNGWSLETDNKVKHWITHSVGFAGPDAQYAVVIMFDQEAGGTVGTGVRTVSDIIATVFGAKVPANVTVPPTSTGG